MDVNTVSLQWNTGSLQEQEGSKKPADDAIPAEHKERREPYI